MADCHNIFIEFGKMISLSKSKKSGLKKSRIALRKTIRRYMQDNKPKETQPRFYSQGSFATLTAINPIPVDGKYYYDLDDGIYFESNEEDRKSVETYHNWICDAVKDHTKESVKDKNTCVRVTFSDGHHIDLPIYHKDKDDSNSIPCLAHRTNDWVESDPKAFIEWFKEKKSDQILRFVKYIKAWADYQSQTHGKMPSGFILTILVVNHYYKNEERDDLGFLDTIKSIKSYLKREGFICKRPTVDTTENLFEKYSQNQKDKFQQRLDELIKDGDRAIQNGNQRTACEKWQIHFGPRMPCNIAKDELEDAKNHSNPAIIKSPATSA